MAVSEFGRGRPRTALVDRLRVSLWAHSVMHAMGAITIDDLEHKLATKHRIRLSSGLWSRYLRGDVLPQGASGLIKGSLVQRLGLAYRTTTTVFAFPVWRYLPWSATVELERLRGDYLALGDTVAVHFVARVHACRERAFPERAAFWHMGKSMIDRHKAISTFDPWTRLVLWLMEAIMAYGAQQHERFVQCQLMACTELKALQRGVLSQSLVHWTYLLMEGMCLDALVATTLAPALPDYRRGLWESASEARRNWKNRVQGLLDVAGSRDLTFMTKRLADVRAWQVGDW